MPSYLLNDICKKYERSKLRLLKTLTELTIDKSNFENFAQCNIYSVVKPFLNDSSSAVQNASSMFLSRAAETDEYSSQPLINLGIIPELMRNVWQKEHTYQVNALKILRALGAHSDVSANVVLDIGGLDHIETVFSSFDKVLLAHAVYAAGRLGSYPETAKKFANSLQLFYGLLHNSDVHFLTSVVSALGDISRVSEEVTRLMKKDIFKRVATLLENSNILLKETVLATLARFASHSSVLAKEVVKTGALSSILNCMNDKKGNLRKLAIDVIIQIVKHDNDTAALVIKAKGIPAIIKTINASSKIDRQKSIELLGVMSQYPEIARDIEKENVVNLLMSILHEEKNIDMVMSIIWTLGEMAQNSHGISTKIANENFLPILIRYLKKPKMNTCYSVLMRAFKSIYQNCVDERMMGIFYTKDIQDLPQQVIEHAAANLSMYLPLSPKARVKFLESGGLKRLLHFNLIKTDTFMENKLRIINCYPRIVISDLEHRLERELPETRDIMPACWSVRDSYSGLPIWCPYPLQTLGNVPSHLPKPTALTELEEWLPFPEPPRGGAPRLMLRASPGPAPRVSLPPLLPGEVGPQPLKISCDPCCELYSPHDDICCFDFGLPRDEARECLIIPHDVVAAAPSEEQNAKNKDAGGTFPKKNAGGAAQQYARESQEPLFGTGEHSPKRISNVVSSVLPDFELVLNTSDSVSASSSLKCCSNLNVNSPWKTESPQTNLNSPDHAVEARESENPNNTRVYANPKKTRVSAKPKNASVSTKQGY